MRAPALYVYKTNEYTEKLEPFRDELDDKVHKYFLNKTPEKLIGEDN